MAPERIRPIALCVFRRSGSILVYEGNDPQAGGAFYRPLGGGIEFGERAVDAARREIVEELGADSTDLRLVGILENIFTYRGQPRHEIVFVFDGRLIDESLYDRPVLPAREADGALLTAVWKRLDDFGPGRPPLYPAGLLELLKTASSCPQ